MLIFIIAFALDTLPVKPLPVLLPRPVRSEKTKSDDKNKNRKIDDANRRVLGNRPTALVSR